MTRVENGQRGGDEYGGEPGGYGVCAVRLFAVGEGVAGVAAVRAGRDAGVDENVRVRRLGRTVTVTAPDGSVTRTEYLTAYGSYTGNLVKVTDPAGKWKVQQTDGAWGTWCG